MLFSRFTRSIETILIVEDEPLVAFDNELRVVDAGYRVVATVDTEAEAIAVLEREPIHLVLADVNLSRGGSGVEVARVASERDIPVLFASLPFQLRIIAKASLGRFPFLGWHLRRAGHMLVDRARRGAAATRLRLGESDGRVLRVPCDAALASGTAPSRRTRRAMLAIAAELVEGAGARA